MMMITNPTIQIPPWGDPTDHVHSPFYDESEMTAYDDVFDDVPLDAFSSDHFRMYEFKIRRCARARSHDWTECPYSHPGEKARRRDPRKFHYSGNPCPEFRKGACVNGDTCDFAHGVFECWLHPSRYRTHPCKDGVVCRRRICFFAHTPEQLRVGIGAVPVSQNVLTQVDSYDGSPSRFAGKSVFGSSPTSTLYGSPASCSPPLSPVGQSSVNELTCSVRNMQIGNTVRCCSPRVASTLRFGSGYDPSLPDPTRTGCNVFDLWDKTESEEPVMERVESGREIRAKMYAKLSRENSLVGRVDSGVHDGWVSELVN